MGKMNRLFYPSYAASDLNRDGRVNNIDADILAEQWYNRNQGVERVVGRYYYHFDGLGSVSAVLDGVMAVVEYYTYDVYGSFRVHSPGSDGACFTADDTELAASSFDNPYGFTGRRWDAEIGLYHYRARMYNPAVGRFIQTDPIGYEDSLNLYLYCLNNPIMLIDPSGQLPEWMWNALANMPIEQLTDVSAGMGDVISFDVTRKFRDWTGLDREVNMSSGWYRGGEIAGAAHGIVMGGGRLAYAGAAKVGSVVYGIKASKGGLTAVGAAKSAMRYRNTLKTIFRGGRSSFRMYTYEQLMEKYKNITALIKASGRTNKYFNIAGSLILYNAIDRIFNSHSDYGKK